MFAATEQRLADQARQIQVNKWLTDVEIVEIERRCQTLNQERETGERADGGLMEEERNVERVITGKEGDGRRADGGL